MKHPARMMLIVSLLAAAALLPAVSNAQVLQGLALERLGVLSPQGAGPRPLAMGGAYTAAGDDVFSLLYNPAGLVEIGGNEFSIGLHHRSDEIENTYLSLRATQSNSSTTLGHLAAAYAYPTYRGNFVLGFGVFQAANSNLESIKSAYLAGIPAAVENMYVQTGTLYQYVFGAAIDISPSISVGGGLSIWDQSIEWSEKIDQVDSYGEIFWRDDVSLDLDGASFNAGLLIRLTEALRIGFSFMSPTWFSYNGEGITRCSGTDSEGDPWTTDPASGIIDEDYTLPMKWSGGAALVLPSVTVGADVSYTDYSQTKYNGLTIRSEIDPGLRSVLEPVWSFGAGAEVRLPMAPVSVRGGYRYTPIELSSVEEISYFETTIDPISQIGDFTMKRERQYWSVGLGGVVDRVLALDLAVVFGGYEKVTSDGDETVFTEQRYITELVLSGTYRF